MLSDLFRELALVFRFHGNSWDDVQVTELDLLVTISRTMVEVKSRWYCSWKSRPAVTYYDHVNWSQHTINQD